MNPNQHVFISYAAEDRHIAKKLYEDLSVSGLVPWMDSEDILPGQNRELEIKKAIRNCAYFLPLLSVHSISKRGYVQKEQKMALNILDEYSQDDIFIIPLRTDDCEPVDERLKNLQCVDLFPSYHEAIVRILGVLAPKNLDRETISRRPYKFLNAYSQKDSAFFFGRDLEKSKCLSKIASYPQMLLYGKSGVGKTSLIQAGIIPALSAAGYQPIYARVYDDPNEGIRQAVSEAFNISISEHASLQACIFKASQISDSPVIFFLDQFEEIFVNVDPQSREDFIQSLGNIFQNAVPRIKIVFSFREDYLAELSTFSPYTSEIFNNFYRLMALTSVQATEAILQPGRLCGISYEEGLIEGILDDLGEGSIDPPQLQIVCDSLFDALQPDENLICFRHYHQLGGAGAILSGYIEHALQQYPFEKKRAIQHILKAFITSVDTKAVLPISKLVKRSRMTPEKVAEILDELVRLRLVHRVESGIQYELAHEYMVNHISTWIDFSEREERRAQEILEQGLAKWERYGLLLSRGELSLIDRHFHFLDGPALEFVARSAVQADFSVSFWLKNISDDVKKSILTEALQNEKEQVRKQALVFIASYGLGNNKDNSQNDMMKDIEDIMINDPEADVRHEAAKALAKTDQILFISCIEKRLKGPPHDRDRSLEAVALAQIHEIELDFSRTSIKNMNWQMNKWWLKRQWPRRKILMSYLGMGGGVGAFIGAVVGYPFTGLPSHVFLTVVLIPALVGMLVGFGVGYGMGIAESANIRAFPLSRVIAAGIGGGLSGLIFGMAGMMDPNGSVLSPSIELAIGLLCGSSLEIIFSWTRKFKNKYPRILLLLLLLFAFFMGALCGLGTESGILYSLDKKDEIRPIGGTFGFCFAFFAAIGMGLAVQSAKYPLIIRRDSLCHGQKT